MNLRILPLALVAALLAVGCSSAGGTSPPQSEGGAPDQPNGGNGGEAEEQGGGNAGGASSACVPGQQLSCSCSDGTNGTQTCAQDGASFGPCGGCATGQGGAAACPYTHDELCGVGALCGPTKTIQSCGGVVDCGSCAPPRVCSATGSCCQPATAAQACAAGSLCGQAPDNCGGFVDCGGCASPATCLKGTTGYSYCCDSSYCEDRCGSGPVCPGGGVADCGACSYGTCNAASQYCSCRRAPNYDSFCGAANSVPPFAWQCDGGGGPPSCVVPKGVNNLGCCPKPD